MPPRMRETIRTPFFRRAGGFNLIEMTMVLVAVSLLVGSILVPLTTQVAQRQVSDTEKTLEEIKEAIMGYAAANGYLPCPDLTAGAGANDGQEDVTGSACTNTLGNVPWATLGVPDRDVWSNRFRYRVDPDFTNRAPPFTFTSVADLRVCTTTACTTRLTAASPDGAVAVILSLGKNGLGAINALTGVANPAPPVGSDEDENRSGSTYVSRVITDIGTTAGEFDDIVIWISKYTLFNRMVAAGKLP